MSLTRSLDLVKLANKPSTHVFKEMQRTDKREVDKNIYVQIERLWFAARAGDQAKFESELTQLLNMARRAERQKLNTPRAVERRSKPSS